MKAVTEFPGFVLTKAIQVKDALTGEGKTPEDIQKSLGETYKFEGEKLTCFVNAIEVASKTSKSLKRVVVLRLNEGEASPTGATKIEELVYVPEFLVLTVAKPPQKPEGKGGRQNRGGGRGGPGGPGKNNPKESPWGLSPEEKAAKLAKKPAGTPTKPN